MNNALVSLSDGLARQLRERTNSEPAWIALAPGRVNLIGDHTDYSGGLALPMAVDLYTVAVAAPRHGKTDIHRIFSIDQGEAAVPASKITLASGDWADYLRGVQAEYVARGINSPAMDIVIGGNLPIGAGLSSSASLELCFATLLEAAAERTLNALERALLCQRAEHRYAGVPCGILDQFTVSFAKAGSAMLLDCRTQQTTSVALPTDVAIAIVDSGVSHALCDGGYAQRRQEVAEAEELLGKSLRDCVKDDLQSLGDSQIRARARHVISENQRVMDFAAAIARGDLADAGRLMYASHESLAQDFLVSCSELDTLVEAAQNAGAIGARMTGGGFGGSMVCLVNDRIKADFEERVSSSYCKAGHGTAVTRWVNPVAAASARSYP